MARSPDGLRDPVSETPLSLCRSLIPFAALLAFALSARAGDAAWSIKTLDAAAPTELEEPIRSLLGGRCVQLLDGQGEVVVELWFRKETPAKATEIQIKNGLTYREIAESTVLGALRVYRDFTDYRKQKIAPGVYTLRLAFQPPTDDHTGSAPYTEFCLACPAGEDKKADLLEPKALQELSIKSTGKHPAVFLLFPGKNLAADPKLVAKGDSHWVLMVRLDAAAGDAKAALAVGLTLVGASPKAKDG
jgi:hypothetical protein